MAFIDIGSIAPIYFASNYIGTTTESDFKDFYPLAANKLVYLEEFSIASPRDLIILRETHKKLTTYQYWSDQ